MNIDFTFLFYGLLFFAFLIILLRAVKIANQYMNEPRRQRKTFTSRY